MDRLIGFDLPPLAAHKAHTSAGAASGTHAHTSAGAAHTTWAGHLDPPAHTPTHTERGATVLRTASTTHNMGQVRNKGAHPSSMVRRPLAYFLSRDKVRTRARRPSLAMAASSSLPTSLPPLGAMLPGMAPPCSSRSPERPRSHHYGLVGHGAFERARVGAQALSRCGEREFISSAPKMMTRASACRR